LPTGTFYNPVTDWVMIDSSDVFNDYVILHEYSHYLEGQISGFAAVPLLHDGCFARDVFGGTINSAEHAWMEGFADYFVMMVASLQPAGRLTGTVDSRGIFRTRKRLLTYLVGRGARSRRRCTSTIPRGG
jgi:hypothetical protein